MNHRYEKRELASPAPKTEHLPSFTARHESIMIGLLILFGLGGLAYIPFNPFGGKGSSQRLEYASFGSKATTSTSGHQRSESSVPVWAAHPQLLIEGKQKAGEQLQFTIENYDSKAEYRLFIGAKKWIPISHKTFEYTFEQPGTYELLLKVSFESETAVLHREDLQIESDWLSSVGK